jgi:hypothetical protein
MKELAEIFLPLLKASSTRQFNTIVKLLVFVTSIITANKVYTYFFGVVDVNLDFKAILATVLNSNILIWVLLFLFFYFGIYPILAKGIVIIYRILYPIDEKYKSKNMQMALHGIKIAGGDVILDQLPRKEKEEFYKTALPDLIYAEMEMIERYMYISIIFIQYLIFFKPIAHKNLLFLGISAFIVLLLLMYIFFVLPKIFKLLRNIVEVEFNNLKNESILSTVQS